MAVTLNGALPMEALYCIAVAMQRQSWQQAPGDQMKNASIPSLRVSAELRKQAESVLKPGESLSSFALEALTRSIEYRKSQREFIERGLLGAAEARASGKYVPAETVLEKLARKLAKAKKRAA
jgi:predicted transcriptional regulator